MLGDPQMTDAMEADTVLRMREGARAGTAPGPRAVGGIELEYDSANGVNPLVWAAGRLLDMVAQIRSMPQLDDLAKLRRQLVMEVRAFEQRAQSVGVARDELIGARYCLCTVLDEAAAHAPWGSKGAWAKQSLLVSFHNEAWGGEKYYLLLARLAQNPERHKNLIELLYYCNALGFEGRFRIIDNGYSQLEILKRRIASILDKVKGGYETRLAPHWQGVSSTPPAWRLVPPWVVAVLCGLIGLGIYLWFLFSLGSRSDIVYAQLAAMKIPEPAVAVVQRPTGTAEMLRRFLEQEIREGLVEVTEKANRCIVTLTGDGLFESGSADIRFRYLSVLKRIADALGEIDGNVLVSGYTDNVPMRSLRFPSNWELSQARAEAVKGLLDSHLGRAGRVRAEGRGEAEPIAPNDTREGRARNRRVEITVLLSAEAIQRQLGATGGKP
ncbi:MAG: DotU family type VI secretion system protein [Azoarcus sp.]|jgi:type VI secretion system protein ImpK|nr:DotU family type VI secretion system protein [Azoarcus sp.]